MKLTREQIQKISGEAAKVGMEAAKATGWGMSGNVCGLIAGPIAATIIAAALKERHGDEITRVLLGEQ